MILPPVLLLETAPSDTFVQSELLLSLEPLWSLPGCFSQRRPCGPFVKPGVIHYFMSNLFVVKFPCWPLHRCGVSLDEANDLYSLLDEGYLQAKGRAVSVVNHEEVVDVREVIPCQGGDDVRGQPKEVDLNCFCDVFPEKSKMVLKWMCVYP